MISSWSIDVVSSLVCLPDKSNANVEENQFRLGNLLDLRRDRLFCLEFARHFMYLLRQSSSTDVRRSIAQIMNGFHGERPEFVQFF